MKLLDEEEIIKNKINIDKNIYKGVYFLINKNKIVYVGNSKNILARIAVHLNKNKILFDSYYFIEKSQDSVELESRYILKFLPKNNTMIASNKILINKLELISLNLFRKILRNYIKENNLNCHAIPFTKLLNTKLKSNKSKKLYKNSLKSVYYNNPKLAYFYVKELLSITAKAFNNDLEEYQKFYCYFKGIYNGK
jgi:hypothetical protein